MIHTIFTKNTKGLNKISVYKTRKKFFDKLKKINVKNGIEKVFLLIKLAYEKKEREIKS